VQITSLGNSVRFNEISNSKCFYNIITELMRNGTEIPNVYSCYDFLVYDTVHVGTKEQELHISLFKIEMAEEVDSRLLRSSGSRIPENAVS
jgi:hypothetical protein